MSEKWKTKSTISQSLRWPLQVSCLCCPKPKEIHFTVIKNGKSNLVTQAGSCRNYFPNYQTFHLSQEEKNLRQRTIVVVVVCFFSKIGRRRVWTWTVFRRGRTWSTLFPPAEGKLLLQRSSSSESCCAGRKIACSSYRTYHWCRRRYCDTRKSTYSKKKKKK